MNWSLKRYIFILVSAILFITIVETFSYIVTKYYIPRSPLSFILYDRNHQPELQEVENYYARRDPILGWPPKDAYGTKAYGDTGARPLPAFPEQDNECVSLYGDSYTYSSSVMAREAWANLLSIHLGCRVANYGVIGYGTDQALLRFVRNTSDDASIVILGIATVDIIRLVNQDRRLIWAIRSSPMFKPRYRMSEDRKIEIVKMPAVPIVEMNQYFRTPEQYLSQEWFLPDTEDGPVVLQFPYSISLVRGLMLRRVLNKLFGKPSWLHFYAANHGSGALPLLIEISREFVRVAKARGKHPIILIIPTSQDIWYARKTGKDPTEPLIQELQAEGLDYLNILPGMLDHLKDDDVCRVFTEKTWLGYCWGHYNAEGEEVIASHVYDLLTNKGLAHTN